MKHLLIDAGNSFCKLALYDDGTDQIQIITKLEYLDIEASLDKEFKNLLVKSVLISNVNNHRLDDMIRQMAKNYWDVEAKNLTTRISSESLKSNYRNFDTLGCDRWAAMIGLFYQNIGNFCVIDCGTAITIDIVIEACHKGGLIAPGIQTSLNSLNQNTANLPKVDLIEWQLEPKIAAISTQDCIITGALLQAVALIEKSVKKFKNIYGQNLSVFITGGDAQLLCNLSEYDYIYKHNLVFDGLRMAIKHKLIS